jgi:recombination protein RecA
MTISQNLKTIVPSLGLSKTALVLINQIRIKIGVMYGNPETTPGGVALRFYSSVRMRVAKKGTLGSRGNEHDPNDIEILANSQVGVFLRLPRDRREGKRTRPAVR